MKQALADALSTRGYDKLTPVQEAVTTDDLIGADLLVSAQTGSGKTLGFGLAIAPTLLGEEEAFGQAAAPLALVIAPTRELALQVKRELSWLYANTGAHLASTVGGMDMRDERRALSRGTHIVVATPGRLRDHIMRGSIDLSSIRAVVLDEADEMLDLGFREDLEFILGEAPEDRQTLMFSATVPKMIATLAKNYQRDAVRVSTKGEASQHADIEYIGMSVAPRDVENAIINVLRYYEAPNAIVFGNTRVMVNRLTTRLSNRGFSVVALSGELSQAERTTALQSMRDGRARVCVATDVAARGIDLPNLDLVIHAELPSNHETLLHRSGRTGRAGRKGVSALIAPPSAKRKADRLLHFAKLKAEWGPAPSADMVRERDEARMMDDPQWSEPVAEAEAPAVEKLVETFSAEQLAAAYLRLHHERKSAPEELSDVDAKPERRAPFGPGVWFSVAGGREARAEPRRLLPMLCKAGDLSKDDIGRIRVKDKASFVEISEASVQRFLKAIGPDMTVEHGAAVTQLDGPPAGVKDGKLGSHSKPRPRREDRPERSERPARAETPAGSEKAQSERPARDEPAEAPKAKEPKWSPDAPKPERKISTAPVDYDDERKPRPKKPKPDAKGKSGAKSGGKPAPKGERREGGPEDLTRGGAVRPGKPKRDRGDGPKGPPPPKGKPNSKKNRARAAAKRPERAPGPASRRGRS
ncbi:MAG: DEAD/DEAH box helicase [Pseudomonadota bacterium]